MAVIPQVIPFVIGVTEAPALTGDLTLGIGAPVLSAPVATGSPVLAWAAGEPSLNWFVGSPTLNT